MTTILITFLVTTLSGTPIRGAWVGVEGMVTTNAETADRQLTDSRGRYMIEIEPGQIRKYQVTHQDYQAVYDEVEMSLHGAVVRVELSKREP